MINPSGRTGSHFRGFADMRLVLFFFLLSGVCLPEGACRADVYRPWTPPPPVYEVYPEEVPVEPPVPEAARDPAGRPKAALILDDVGYSPGIIRKFLSLDLEITYSILPFSPFASRLSDLIRKRGRERMLHIPMEPEQYPSVDPGPEALLETLSPEVLAARLEGCLDAFPGILGVNNHMGSRLTCLPAPMFQVMAVLKARELYFIDSRTASGSVCRGAAVAMRLPFGARDVFLDHDLSAPAIRRQVSRLIRSAEVYGEAVGIAHPHAVTYRVLKEQLTVLKKKIEWVPASRIVRIVD